MQTKFNSVDNKCYSLEDYKKNNPDVKNVEQQWESLPECPSYDSTADTLKHKIRVAHYLMAAANELLKRADKHDDSKLQNPEKSWFDIYTPFLANSVFGSDEYNQFLQKLKIALDHHYANNSHHPQYYEEGISGMDLFDLIEMFFDWKAACERHTTANLNDSIEINIKRFGIDSQLASIIKNTHNRFKEM